MSEVHILFNTFFAIQPHTLPYSSPSPSPRFFAFLLSRRAVFFLTGDLAQLKLPVGMKDLNLRSTKVTGKA